MLLCVRYINNFISNYYSLFIVLYIYATFPIRKQNMVDFGI